MNHELKLYTPLSPEECSRRLAAAIDSSFIGSRMVVGRVKKGSIRLRERISYRNSFQTFLTARLLAHGSGTLIEGEVGLSTSVRVFLWIWFGFLTVAGGTLIVFSLWKIISNPSHDPQDWLGVLIPCGMALGALFVFRFGRALAGNEGTFLKEFLCRTLDAGPEMTGA